MLKNCLIIIPARGNSKGIPRKNLRHLNGKPLIQYSIETALSFAPSQNIIVSTEDDEIAAFARSMKVVDLKRPENFSQDHSTLDEVIFCVIQQWQEMGNTLPEFIVTMQATSPMLKAESLKNAISKMQEQKTWDVCLSAVEQTHLAWGKREENFYPKYKERLNRQYLEPNFLETGGFVINRQNFLAQKSRIFGNVQLHILDDIEGIDIDTAADWGLCEFHLSRKTVVFSISGYSTIGTGHVYNSLSIANCISGHEVQFIVDEKSDLAKSIIASNNFPVQQFPIEQIPEEIGNLNADLIINDRLDTGKEYMTALSKIGPVINFEDLGEGCELADLLINAMYPKKGKKIKEYSGPKYFCGKEQFYSTPTININEEVKNILITFGGTDPCNLSLKTLQAIYHDCQKRGITIRLILGLGYGEAVSNFKEFDIDLIRTVADMAGEMAKADIIFTSAGRTAYEAALLGIPCIIMAQNEREFSHVCCSNPDLGFLSLGLGSDVTNLSIQEALQNYLPLAQRREVQRRLLKLDIRAGRQYVIDLLKAFL